MATGSSTAGYPLITQLPGGVFLTTAGCRFLYQIASIGELRTRYRGGDNLAHEFLTQISVTAFSDPAEVGKEPRQDAASDKADYWDTNRVARTAKVSPRTVRNDAATGLLPGTKTGNGWIFTEQSATTYAKARRRR